MKNRQLIIHIGTEKTGTSSIQKVLSENRERLIDHNILYPRIFGKVNHSYLSSACLDDDVFDNLKAHILAHENWTLAQLRSHLQNGFGDELNAHNNVSRILVSTELIHSRLVRSSEIERMLDFFSDHVDEIRIILLIRRQDRLAVSRFSTALRAGYTDFDTVFGDLAAHQYTRCPPHKLPNDLLDYYDYQKLIERFIPYLGKENIHVGLYEEGTTVGVEQFLRLASIDQDSVVFGDIQLNNAMSVQAQFLISELNKIFPSHLDSGLRNKKKQSLRAYIETDFSGEIREYEKQEAEQFLSIFAKSNEWVREQFFHDQTTLFDSDFSKYVDSVDYNYMKNRLLPKVPELKMKYLGKTTIKDIVKHRFIRLSISIGKRFRLDRKLLTKTYHSFSKRKNSIVRYLEWKLALVRHSGLPNMKRTNPDPQPTFVLCRILGNDLYPRHSDTQSIDNLVKIIEEEDEFENCSKFFLVNRIFDEAKERLIISCLENNNVDYRVIPFKFDEYAKCEYDYESVGGESFFNSEKFKMLTLAAKVNASIFVCRHKISYAMNVNGARNYAIQTGSQIADWILPWDGSCAMTRASFQTIRDSCCRMPKLALRVVPMARMISNDINLNLFEPQMQSEEPQLVFHKDCTAQFNEDFPYGIRDKTELLQRFGVPGPWHTWSNNPWLPAVKNSELIKGQFDYVNAYAIRLASGQKKLDETSSNINRYQSRNTAILKTIRFLDQSVSNDIPDFLELASTNQL